MTIGGYGHRPTKNERREAARERARQMRVDQVKKDKRRKALIQLGVIVGVLAVVGIVGGVIVTNMPQPGPRPANMASDGIVLTAELGTDGKPTGKVVAEKSSALAPGAEPVNTTPVPDKLNIVEYLDYMCPICGGFDRNDSEVMFSRVKSGEATLELHPIAILNPNSQGTMYSTRAANAAACVANFEPNGYWDFNQLLFANQPAEGTTGLDDSQLVSYAQQATGNTGVSLSDCINNRTFGGWVSEATKRVTGATTLPNSDVKFSGTPTVIVNGVQYVAKFEQRDNDPAYTSPVEFEAFLLEQQGKLTGSASPTPAP